VLSKHAGARRIVRNINEAARDIARRWSRLQEPTNFPPNDFFDSIDPFRKSNMW